MTGSYVICYVCKIAMEQTELKDIYKCSACGMVADKREEDGHRTIQRRTKTR